MKNFSSLILLALSCLLFSQCGKGTEGGASPDFDSHISAYTGGTQSRKGDVRIVFSSDIAQETLAKIDPEKLISLSPKADGKCAFVDARTLIFTPSAELKRNTTYTVSLDGKKLFDDGKTFTFDFTTRPFALSASLKRIEENDADEYVLLYNVTTADSEAGDVVESHVQCSLPCKSAWTHLPDGMTHQLTVTIKPTKDTNLDIVAVADGSLGLASSTLCSTDLPSRLTFTLMNIACKADDRHYIELTFNKALDSKQNVKGLIYVEGRSTQLVAEDNKVRVYADLKDGESVSLVIDKSLRSRSGSTIGETLNRTVAIEGIKPEVAFVGNGTIIPQSDQILVPFRAIHMRGVRVLVFKIFGNMVGSMMQRGDIDTYAGLYYAARPIAATTFFIDNQGSDLSEWHTYAIDLTRQVQLEPGAMYRIELSLDARLSAWPSDSLRQATADEMAREDAALLERMCGQFDKDSYYYTGMAYTSYEDGWWSDDYYQKHRNPAMPQYYRDRVVAKNVLATNIGLSAIKGSDNKIRVVTVNLPDAQPMNGVEIEAYNMQQQLVGSSSTGSDGIAQIAYSANNGQPIYLTARRGNDVSYLKVDAGSSLSTSSFDVSGRTIERGLKGYIYGERGVWRPGDTIHIGFMLNDKNHNLPAEHPVTLRLYNPLGQIVHNVTRTSGIMGTYAFSIPTEPDAPTGIWTAKVEVGGVAFEKNLRVEAIKPNRLKIDLKLPAGALANGTNSAQLHTEWLNGNTASQLKYEVTSTIVATKTTWKAWKDYTFDDASKSFETTEQSLAKGQVNATGDADLALKFAADKKTAPGLLKCNLVTHVYEPSGEFSTDVSQALIAPYPTYIGIKSPQMVGQNHLDTDKSHVFDVVSVDKDGQPKSDVNITVKVYKIDWYWWWHSSGSNLAEYASSRDLNEVKRTTCTTNAEGKGTFSLRINEANWGRYLIVAEDDRDHHSASVVSYFDWPWMSSRDADGEGNGATSLAISTDKKEYAPGDKMRISVPSEEGSRAIVSICNGSNVLYLNSHPCVKGQTEIVLDVTDQMTPNIYVGVSLVQPYSQTVNDLPIRMYGIVPVAVTSAKSHLAPTVTCADEFRPETDCKVTVAEKDGRPMSYTLAIVDEGLLDLTHFKTPDAWSLFNAREALGVRFWDLYRHVNGAYGGRLEQMFSIGGDEALNNAPKAIVNRFTPMVHFAGPFALKKGEKRTHDVHVPNYNGRVRVMVVAGDGDAYGCAEKSVQVRRPLMLIGTMPRQIGVNDEMTVSATVFATQKLGKVKVNIDVADGLAVVGEKSQQLTFDEPGDKTVQFRIKAGESGGMSTVAITAASGSEKADYVANIDLRTVSQKLTQSAEEKIEPGATFEREITLPGNSDFSLLVDVSAVQPLNIVGRIDKLLAYPHGCVEQTTSKAFPQLYLADFADLTPAQSFEVEENVKNCIRRLATFQTTDGGMSYWPNGQVSSPWPSAYVLHFLTEASARGYFVSDDMMRRLRKYVAKQAGQYEKLRDNETAAYMLFTLANAQAFELGAMNRMREHSAELTETGNCLLAAAYAMSGRQDIGQELLKSATKSGRRYWIDVKSARLLAQDLLADPKAVDTAEALRKVLMSDQWLSTSQCAFSLVAMSRYFKNHVVAEGTDFTASIDGKKVGDVQSKKFSWSIGRQTDNNKVKLQVKNRDKKAPLYLSITANGIATQSKVSRIDNGLDLSLRYFTAKGEALDPASLPLSTTFEAELTVRNTSGEDLTNVAVTHIVPAGWEILSSTPSGTIHYQDRRDDRLLSYIDLLRKGESVSISLTLSATYAGSYYLPAVQAEAMYDASISGCTASQECEVK
ncbi:MAG: hypothetical protein E7070_03150 [Bacteroidales bacterium]|nr:hypothetical protein [Bacteroidales bacterium]